MSSMDITEDSAAVNGSDESSTKDGAKSEDTTANGDSPDVVVEQEDEETEEGPPKPVPFRPFQLSKKVLSDCMEASFFNRSVIIEPYKPELLDNDVIRRIVHAAQRLYIQTTPATCKAGQGQSFVELYFASHKEAEAARKNLDTEVQEPYTIRKVSTEHLEGAVKHRDYAAKILPGIETKAQYRSRMLLASLVEFDESAPAPEVADVLDAAAQMFPGAIGITVPLPHHSRNDPVFRGYILAVYRTPELAKQSHDEWKGKDVFILGKQVKIDLFQQAAHTAQGHKKAEERKSGSPKSQNNRGNKAMKDALAEIASSTDTVSSKPLSPAEKEKLTQRIKEIKSTLANLRQMKKAGFTGVKQRQTMRRQLVTEMQKMTKLLKGENAEVGEDGEEEDEEGKTKDSKPSKTTDSKPSKTTEQKKNNKKQNNNSNKDNNKKPSSAASGSSFFFTQPQYKSILHRHPNPMRPRMPHEPRFIPPGYANRPMAPHMQPQQFVSPFQRDNRAPRFIPPGSIRPSASLNMKDVQEVNESLQSLQEQVQRLTHHIQAKPQSAPQGGRSPQGILGDYPGGRGRGGGRGGRSTHGPAAGRGGGYYGNDNGFDEDFNRRHAADLLRNIDETLNSHMSTMNINPDYQHEQFEDYYSGEDFGGGYQRMPKGGHRDGGYGEPVGYREPGNTYTEHAAHNSASFYQKQNRGQYGPAAGRGMGASYSQAKAQGFIGQGRGGILQHQH